FYEPCFACFIDKTEGVNTKAFHHAETTWNCTIREYPHNHVHRFWYKGDEIPEIIVCGRGLWHLVMGFGFNGMDKVREFNPILNEKDWHIISDKVENTILRIELGRKAANIAHGVRRSTKTDNC